MTTPDQHVTCPVCQRVVGARHGVMVHHLRDPDADADRCPASGLTTEQAQVEVERELDRFRRLAR